MKGRDVPLQLTVIAGVEPVGCHDVCGLYVETFWTPIVGPSAMLAARWLARRLHRYPGPLANASFTLDVAMLGEELGLRAGRDSGRPLTIMNALYRLSRFGPARLDESVLLLPMLWPTLSAEQVAWLPERLRSVARPPERTAAR